MKSSRSYSVQYAILFADAHQRLRFARRVIDAFPQTHRGAVVGPGARLLEMPGHGQGPAADRADDLVEPEKEW